MTFAMITEDPFYDEDGVLVDEDADWQDIADTPDVMSWLSNQLKDYDATYSPFDTVNS